jgi:hypothetical protein
MNAYRLTMNDQFGEDGPQAGAICRILFRAPASDFGDDEPYYAMTFGPPHRGIFWCSEDMIEPLK